MVPMCPLQVAQERHVGHPGHSYYYQVVLMGYSMPLLYSARLHTLASVHRRRGGHVVVIGVAPVADRAVIVKVAERVGVCV